MRFCRVRARYRGQWLERPRVFLSRPTIPVRLARWLDDGAGLEGIEPSRTSEVNALVSEVRSARAARAIAQATRPASRLAIAIDRLALLDKGESFSVSREVGLEEL